MEKEAAGMEADRKFRRIFPKSTVEITKEYGAFL